MLTFWNDREVNNPWRSLFEFTDGRYEGVARPSAEVNENETHYLVRVDLPGVPEKDIKIELSENVLTISGERKDRMYGKFYRAYTLPQDVDAEKIEASYENGVLSVALPKTEAAKPRQIKIGEGKSSFFGKLVGDKKENSKTH